MAEPELDVRTLRKPEKHPRIFATFAELGVGESFVLVNNHNPIHLHDEFERDLPGGYGWEYVESGPKTWRIRISRVASTALPRVVAGADTLSAQGGGTGWELQVRDRDLDAATLRLDSNETVAASGGPDFDILLYVLDGAGRVGTERDDVVLTKGALAWLPRRSSRSLAAGPEGLVCLRIHQRRHEIPLSAAAIGGLQHV